MDFGAVIIAAGCGQTAMLPAGGSSVAQRMVSTFQKAGAGLITLVTGPNDKKLEKHLSAAGVLFLKNNSPEDRDASLKLGLEYMQNKCDRIFLVDADRPLLSPDTLEVMLSSRAELTVPSYKGKQGVPWLISSNSAKGLCTSVKVENTLSRLEKYIFPVNDEGVVLGAARCEGRTEAFAEHDIKLSRFMLEISLTRGKPIVDSRLISLLHFVAETQSVRDACARMQISYSTAWNMLNSAEDELGFPLIERNKGGASGAGSMLTEKGSRLLKAYTDFSRRLSTTAQALYSDYFDNII